jgi:hypothetical protein
VLSKSRIFKFLKRDCGTIPVAEITSGKIEIFSKHQRFLIATDSSKYLLIFVLYVCVILCEFGTAISKRYACFCCLFKIIMSGKNLLHSLGLVLQIYEGHDDQLNRPGPMA